MHPYYQLIATLVVFVSSNPFVVVAVVCHSDLRRRENDGAFVVVAARVKKMVRGVVVGGRR
jgi:hypothetical protein